MLPYKVRNEYCSLISCNIGFNNVVLFISKRIVQLIRHASACACNVNVGTQRHTARRFTSLSSYSTVAN